MIQARLRWAREGDAPTAFFFKRVREKQQEDNISGIRNNEGHWETDLQKVGAILTRDLKSVSGKCECMSMEKQFSRERLLGNVCKAITVEDYARCEAPFTAVEIYLAVQALPKGKSPGIDGIPKEFYQQFWGTVKYDVVRMCNEAWSCTQLTHNVNVGLIRLIPNSAARERTGD